MIKTVFELSDFKRIADFGRGEIFYSSETQNIGDNTFPRIEVTQKMSVEGEPLVVYERLSTVSIRDAGDNPNIYAGINEAIRTRIASFEKEVTRLAVFHGCRAVPGTLIPTPTDATLSSILTRRLEAIERRVVEMENTHGRLFASMDGRLFDLEDKVYPPLKFVGETPKDHESRLRRLEKTIAPIIEVP
ncbi:hypothetical protein [Methanofollis ethanolicus]|uniref:hypothetical protein n=1 Tax=Methanofollis ethanolicus TaxID=488124 RepID=UPI00082D1C93|nr:hypothetical protein [Methanofollis ethanolicus]